MVLIGSHVVAIGGRSTESRCGLRSAGSAAHSMRTCGLFDQSAGRKAYAATLARMAAIMDPGSAGFVRMAQNIALLGSASTPGSPV